MDVNDHKMNQKMKLFYLHIPKTGGQTLATRLASAFPIGKVDFMGTDLVHPSGVEVLRRLLDEKMFVERHISGPVLKEFRNLDILTTIRKPVAQIVSNYLHIRREPQNFLYRAAVTLSPREFFSKFGDIYANQQSRYLVSAFFELDIDPEPLRTWSALIFEALDRIRWVVPTESIDEFITLWALDTRRHVPDWDIHVNVANKDASYEELLDIVRGMPELYSVDLLLWQVARQRFTDYRQNVLQTLIPFDMPEDASRAYWNDGSGIWLRSGWYPPEIAPIGMAWWAGPLRYSEIAYSRKKNERYLRFSVVVVCGVSHSEILAIGADRRERLPMTVDQRMDSLWDFWIDLDDLPLKGNLYLWVPEVWSPVMVSETSEQIRRQSFATCDWGFANVTPASCGVDVAKDKRAINSKHDALE